MSVIYIALPVALLLVAAAFLAFRWCIQTGQLDDLENASYRMLHDDSANKRAKSDKSSEHSNQQI